MYHRGKIHNTFDDLGTVDITFQPPERSYWLELWKGWYHKAYRSNPQLPYIPEMVRPRQQLALPTHIGQEPFRWVVKQPPEVLSQTIIFRFRPNLPTEDIRSMNALVLILARQAF